LADIIKLAKHAPWGKVPIIGRLPKGAYYVGDPAFVLRDHWNDFIAAFYAVSDDAAVFEFKGRKCFVSGTNKGGAGTYSDRDGREYIVRSGLIGVIPIDVIPASFARQDQDVILFNSGVFALKFSVGADLGRGKFKRIRIGNNVIDT
jgi:hypothetical protein